MLLQVSRFHNNILFKSVFVIYIQSGFIFIILPVRMYVSGGTFLFFVTADIYISI